jgi:hypothetical protein
MNKCAPWINPVGFDENLNVNNALQYANGARLLDLAGIRVTRQFKNYGSFLIESDPGSGIPANEEPEWEDSGEPIDTIYSNPTQWGQDIVINLAISGGWFGAFYITEVLLDPGDPDSVFYPLLSWGYIIAERIKIEQLPLQPVPIYLTDDNGITTLLQGSTELEYIRQVEDRETWPIDDWEPTVDISDPEYNPTLAATLRIGYPPPIT